MRRLDFLQREPFLIVALILVLTAGFFVTTLAARAYHNKQEQFAALWFARGEQALKQGKPSEAVEDFRSALAYSPEGDLYRLLLGQALIADHRPREARAHLLSLWEKQPGDGLLNLELAHLAANWNDTRQAVRYYHGAIYGVWNDDPMPHRIQARFELIEYLLNHNMVRDAQAELVALANNLPPMDAAAQRRLGVLLLRAGLNERALAAFRAALAEEPNSLPDLAEAGEAAFRLGDYHTARHYLLPIATQNPHDQHSMDLLNMAELIIKMDPFERGVSSPERGRRAVRALQLAVARAQACARTAAAPQNGTATRDTISSLLQQAAALHVSERSLARNQEALERTMDLAFKLETAAADCGAARPQDQALALLAQRWEGPR
jgi:tetratricopeptide (TPR) repeat protein